jgi:serine protease SohB
MERQGIERRVHTAGEDKSLLDPFRPERAEDVERLKALQAQLHETFKSQVTTRRGGKLAKDHDLFTGDVWIGQKAVELGLADGVGHVVPVMKERFGDKVKFRPYGSRRNVLGRFGLRVIDGTLARIEERSLWARYGL